MSKTVIINDHKLVQKERKKKEWQPFDAFCISNTCIIFFLNMKIPFHRINF